MKIVAIGGGTGLSILLRGLKEVSQEITAVVTVADDGGGSGVLREDLGMLPPGDIRNCILALANTEPILQDLLQYRFSEGRLKGQNFGNLMIAAMQGISDGFEDAIRKISDIFAITGKVLPVSVVPMVLYAQLTDGIHVKGESNIPLEVVKRGAGIKKIWVEPHDVESGDEIIEAILSADVVVLGPGSLFTSVIPNLLVDNLMTALNTTRAKRVYVCNIMTQPGETDHFTVSDHVKALFAHTKLKALDAVFINEGTLTEEQMARYLKEDSNLVAYTSACEALLAEMGIDVYKDDLIEVVKGYVRHNAGCIALKLESICERAYTPTGHDLKV
ncbi:MAG: hypothetical protein PWP51_2 [Clostridiales bacterium]|nr:hypothetical protein [Clostridiales bacterium]MDN5297449.1 hypothetical protein [Clostridiales bacterium]